MVMPGFYAALLAFARAARAFLRGRAGKLRSERRIFYHGLLLAAPGLCIMAPFGFATARLRNAGPSLRDGASCVEMT